MTKYLVTGGLGFIGSHLADALTAAGHGVVILDDLSTGSRENAPAGTEIVIGSVTDPALVSRLMAEADGCFHLAAIASVQKCTEDWHASHQVNLGGMVTILDAARGPGGLGKPVVYASSAAVYGNCTDLPLAEDAPKQPLTAYGADKLGCEQHARVGAEVHNLRATALRFFNVYGPRQDPHSPYSGVIARFAAQAQTDQALTLHGTGEQTRDFVYVADVVTAMTAAMARLKAGDGPCADAFNICTGEAISIRQLADLICTTLGTDPRYTPQPARIGDILHSLGDPSRAERELDFRARTSMADGLKKLFASTETTSKTHIPAA